MEAKDKRVTVSMRVNRKLAKKMSDRGSSDFDGSSRSKGLDRALENTKGAGHASYPPSKSEPNESKKTISMRMTRGTKGDLFKKYGGTSRGVDQVMSHDADLTSLRKWDPTQKPPRIEPPSVPRTGTGKVNPKAKRKMGKGKKTKSRTKSRTKSFMGGAGGAGPGALAVRRPQDVLGVGRRK